MLTIPVFTASSIVKSVKGPRFFSYYPIETSGNFICLTLSNFGWDLSYGSIKCSISAIWNSLPLINPDLGAISFLNPRPI